MSATIGRIIAALDELYPREWAADWDRVGPVCGRPERRVDRVLFSVDCVPATVREAEEVGAGMIVTHHPLLLRGVSSLDPTGYKGDVVHRLIENGTGLYTAHTNADVASPGVSDALATALGLSGLRPLSPVDDGPRGIGRIGELATTVSLADFTARVASALPATTWGVRASGDPDRPVRTVAVSGGAGDGYLADAARAGVDAFVTADLRHHVAGEFAETGGPALIDAAHWATEWPWLDLVAAQVRAACDVDTVVSDHNTDPWTVHRASRV
ncbi:dinuclear metal center YbgI/SA1388 family protein [Stackebrandtia albiflava]|uniref:GTP cyclohydrolase 1 type 2 homolog n=1 Tax=Stackebrandtia albiflava TaxID=406432 RepID=A0A562UQJ6_9ACTN|nr:Nif3-like dinuclear metal center hexameric protein [Stackebrandtia albiflava]TWJ07864.1 dinuclear metal center YbgI/SA1388 family protein [Stackebrandtia albiflava]